MSALLSDPHVMCLQGTRRIRMMMTVMRCHGASKLNHVLRMCMDSKLALNCQRIVSCWQAEKMPGQQPSRSYLDWPLSWHGRQAQDPGAARAAAAPRAQGWQCRACFPTCALILNSCSPRSSMQTVSRSQDISKELENIEEGVRHQPSPPAVLTTAVSCLD